MLLFVVGCPGAGPPAKPDVETFDAPILYVCDTVDILFVIDNSDSMVAEQANLIDNFPRFIERIEGIEPPIRSFHVGVISTDLGAGPFTIGENCSPPGDDARLQHEARGAGCSGESPPFLEGPATTLAGDFACIAQLGDDGCGFEQQLEAALKALRAERDEGTGFLRDNAPLAIIFISDEDDCSAQKETFYDPADEELGDMITRCVRLLDRLHPVSRYVDGFKGVKTSREAVVVAAITGPPGDVELAPLDPDLPGAVKPACSSTELGAAAPGNRFAELVEGFGERGVQHTICDGDLAQALDVVSNVIQRICID
jgi:uncharacterized protein YfcZ (UPF0381/DUF406 family)